MKTKLITISMMLIFCTTLFAQRSQNKIGYIDMDYILDNISDYSEANSQLNQKIQTWKGEIDLQQQKIRDLKEDLENERPLLTQDLIDERQDEIEFYQKKMQEYQQQRFGPEGDMIAQRRQIMQPIQDEVFNAVQEIGDKREYDFIFDSSADALMLFSAKRHDISDQILAGIQRHSRKLTGRDNKSETKSDTKDEEQYKSVIQDRLDKEKEEERENLKQEKLDERKATMDERQRQRDSLRAARQEKFQARRDSIQRERDEKTGNRSENSNIKGKEDKQIEPVQKNISEDNHTDQSPESEKTPKTDNRTTNNQEEDQQQTRQDRRQDQKETLKAEREAQRDSIKRVRQEALEKRQKQRDSVIQARNLERKNRNK